MTYKKNRRFCHVCGGTLVQRYKRVLDTATDEGFGILRCTECGLGHTNPVPENLNIHSWFEVKYRIIMEAVRNYMQHPDYVLGLTV